jgi:hypothetical protein
MAKRPTAKRTSPAKARGSARGTVKASRTATRKRAKRASTARSTAKTRVAASSRTSSALFAPVKGAERRSIGHVQLEVGRAGGARVKRMIYPPGFHWKRDMQPVTGTELCMHAHVGFLAHGEIHIEYADGCVVEHRAPQVVAIAPGHDGWVVGDEPVVLIEFDFERDTIHKLGMPDAHRHE